MRGGRSIVKGSVTRRVMKPYRNTTITALLALLIGLLATLALSSPAGAAAARKPHRGHQVRLHHGMGARRPKRQVSARRLSTMALQSLPAQIVSLGTALVVATGVYLAGCRALRVRELDTLLALLARFQRASRSV